MRWLAFLRPGDWLVIACGDRSSTRRVRVWGPQSTGRTTTARPLAGLITSRRALCQNARPLGE